MSADLDTTRIVRSWLRADKQESADRVLDNVLARLDVTPQRHRLQPARTNAGSATVTKLALVAAAVVVIVMAGARLSGNTASTGSSSDAPSTSASTQPSPNPAATSRSDSGPSVEQGKLDPGRFDIPWPLGPSNARIHLTVPDGWAWIDSSHLTIYKDHGRYFAFPVDIAVHDVRTVVSSVCPADESEYEVGPTLVAVGLTVDDLTTAIRNVGGTEWSGPTDLTLGGFPAKRLVSTYSSAECPGPDRRWIWLSDAGAFFVEDGVTSTVYVVNVDGNRLVVTTDDRGSSPSNASELESIVATMDIETGVSTEPTPEPSRATAAPGMFPTSVGPDGDLRIGRHMAAVEGTPFTFGVPTSGWEPHLYFSINKSATGPQDAEATIRWTTLPNGLRTEPCPGILTFPSRPSAADLAEAVARAPGVDVVTGPSETTVGGRPASRVVVSVRQDVGCDPGFFYSFEASYGGAFWTDTNPGDTIMVWVVEVNGTLVFVEAETHADAGPELEREIRQIVESMDFFSNPFGP